MADTPSTEWFAKRRDSRSWAIVAAHVALVFAPVYLAAVLRPSVAYIGLWVWFGLTANGLLNLMHECAHLLAFRRKSSSLLLGRWFLGPLVVADFDSYRERHWAHHRNLGSDDDPKHAYLVDVTGSSVWRFVLRCMFLREAVGKASESSQTPAQLPDPEARPGRLGGAVARILVVQGVLVASLLLCALAAHQRLAPALWSAGVAYVGVYMYGLAALTILAATLRAIAEHQVGDDGSATQGRAALRNFSAGPVGRLFFGAYGFAQHATHHREPGVPHYRLRALTSELAAADPHPDRPAGLRRNAGVVDPGPSRARRGSRHRSETTTLSEHRSGAEERSDQSPSGPPPFVGA